LIVGVARDGLPLVNLLFAEMLCALLKGFAPICARYIGVNNMLLTVLAVVFHFLMNAHPTAAVAEISLAMHQKLAFICTTPRSL